MLRRSVHVAKSLHPVKSLFAFSMLKATLNYYFKEVVNNWILTVKCVELFEQCLSGNFLSKRSFLQNIKHFN